jgi:hypothetical protein
VQSKSAPDLSLLDEALRELAKAQMLVGAAAITSVALTNGDVMIAVMAEPGSKSVSYARIERASKRLYHVADGSPLSGE